MYKDTPWKDNPKFQQISTNQPTNPNPNFSVATCLAEGDK